jgi:transglutaminase-like putative cysteine protease/uncharacterized protein (DUF58 family)
MNRPRRTRGASIWSAVRHGGPTLHKAPLSRRTPNCARMSISPAEPAPASAATKRVTTHVTRNTWAFAAFLLALWYAAVSQGNGAAYALFFFIVAVVLVSWVHAKRNLRGIKVRAGRIEPVFVGGELHVPLTIEASSGNFAAGVEVRSIQAGEATRCGFIRAGQIAAANINVTANQRGAFPVLEIELRSHWPLGIFAVRTRLLIDAPHVIHPTPGGAQPLPEGEPGWLYDRRRGRGDGDEFAGLREFRAGESPRRIHWRSAERSDKLLVTEWEGASGGLRWLDWRTLTASGTEARLAQLTRWVLDAERTGTPYGLRLSDVEIQPGMGPVHRNRCLHAIARVPGAPVPAAVARRARPPEPPLLPGPFGGVLIALLLAAVPISTTLLPLPAAMFAVAILFRIFTRKRGTALKTTPAKLLVCGLAVGGVLISGGGLIGLQPGMSIVLGLIALKALESATRRDFFVLLLLTWFVALCGLFVSQTLPAASIAAALCLFAAAAAAMLYSEDQMRWRLALKRMGMMALQGLPLIALLFLFFPRVQGGFRLTLKGGATGAAGFSEDFDPGNFAKLNENYESAFRAEFFEGNAPNAADLYWRGSVLWDCKGLEWHRGSVYTVEPRPQAVPQGALRHRVTIQPHGERWVFALDRPVFPAKETTLDPGGYLQSMRPINRSTRFEVVSLPRYQDRTLRKDQRAAALRIPNNLPPETKKLAESWRASGGSDAEILDRGMSWFLAQGFSYSLAPERYQGANALDDFLFRRRVGFCSHYAAAFATLMRSSGVPARVVIGYQGGEYNPHGNYFLVRQNDAHAWCEVWIEGKAWQRVDLTQQLAPSRIEAGAESFRDAVDALTGAFRPPAGLADLFGSVRMLWDNLNYQWDVRVVAFDEDAQFEFLAFVGLKDLPRPFLLVGIFSVASLLLGGAGLWLRRVTRPKRDPAGEAWARACQQIARLTGIAREPWEGPHAYAARAVPMRPDAAQTIEQASDLYARIRFSPTPPAISELSQAIDRLLQLRARQ